MWYNIYVEREKPLRRATRSGGRGRVMASIRKGKIFMNQSYSSASTSINSKKLPSVYGKIKPSALGCLDLILDYGAGRYVQHIREYVHSTACRADGERPVYVEYDKYNQSEETNAVAFNALMLAECLGHAVAIISSNVLNVIDSDDTVAAIAEWLDKKAKTGEDIYVTVYEGDKSGVGRQTGADAYQRNLKTREYLRWFSDRFTVKKGVITNRPENIK